MELVSCFQLCDGQDATEPEGPTLNTNTIRYTAHHIIRYETPERGSSQISGTPASHSGPGPKSQTRDRFSSVPPSKFRG
jgi:hypothetical protein